VETPQEQPQELIAAGLRADAVLARSKTQLGVELFAQGDYQRASDLLGEALEGFETAELRNDWAAAEMACGRIDRAEEGFRRALALDSQHSQALVNLGVLLAGAGRAQEAIPVLRHAQVRVDPSERRAVAQLLTRCCSQVASDAQREVRAVVQEVHAALKQCSSLIQPLPAAPVRAAAAATAPQPSGGPPKMLASLARYALAYGPKALTLESSSVCNLRCVMCPQGRGLVNRPRHFPPPLVEKLHPSLGGVEFIQLHGIGEPLHSPAFWRFLETLNTPEGTHIEVNSNMTVLTDDQIGKLLGSRLSLINVSLDSATPETYARIRGYDFNKVINNLKRLIGRRNTEGRAKPEIFLNMTLMRENIEELERFVELGHSLGVNGLQFWHLNAGEDYRLTKKDGWTFDYQQQRLENYPQLSNQRIRAAMALAERLGTTFKLNPSKNLFFEEA